MPLNQGEAQRHARDIRDAVAELEHVAAILPLVAAGQSSGAAMIVLLNAAIDQLQATASDVLTDAADTP